jgi:hypothetical protein
MKRSWIAVAATMGSLVLANSEEAPSISEPPGSAAAQGPEREGRIVFMRGDPSGGELGSERVTFTVNVLLTKGPSAGPRWSPGGTEIRISAATRMAAHVLDTETGDLRSIAPRTRPWRPSSAAASGARGRALAQ